MRDPVTIDEGRQNKLRKEEKLNEELAVSDLTSVLSTSEGRRVLYRLLELCGCGVVNTDPQRFDTFNRLDEHQMAVAIGEQMVGNRMMVDWLTLAPGLYRTMMDEAAKKIAEGMVRKRVEASEEEEARRRDRVDDEEGDS